VNGISSQTGVFGAYCVSLSLYNSESEDARVLRGHFERLSHFESAVNTSLGQVAESLNTLTPIEISLSAGLAQSLCCAFALVCFH